MKTLIFFSLAVISTVFPIYGNVSEDTTEEIKHDLKKYINEIPAIGMIMDRVDYDGIHLANFTFLNGKKYAVCAPGDHITAVVDYEIDSDKLSSLHLHHFIYGLDPSGPQGCLVKSLGFRDSKGTAELTIQAPQDKGMYQVRFCHGKGITYENAKDIWWKKGNPPEKTIMGIVVVK